MMLKFVVSAVLLVALVCGAPAAEKPVKSSPLKSLNKTIIRTGIFADEDWTPPNVYTTLAIGSDNQKFKLLMNQDLNDILLRGPRCTSLSCKGDPNTPERKTYDPKSSSTSKDEGDSFKEKFGTTVSGEYYSDTVNVDGISDTGVALGVLITASTKFYNVAADGVFGLNFLGNTRGKKNFPSPVDSILKNAKSKVVSVWYNKATSNANRYGTLTFGKVNTDNCSSDVQYSLVDDDFAFKVQKIRYMTFTAHRELRAFVDVNSPSIGLPSTLYKDFLRTATGSATQESTSCTKIKDVTLDIKIGGVFYSLKAEDISYKNPASPTYCKFYVTDNGDEFDTGYVLGEPFFRRFCTTYDVQNKQIGFSATK